MTFEKNLLFLNVSTYRNIYRDLFINECARKKKLKYQSLRYSEFYSFLWDVEELMFLIIKIDLKQLSPKIINTL